MEFKVGDVVRTVDGCGPRMMIGSRDGLPVGSEQIEVVVWWRDGKLENSLALRSLLKLEDVRATHISRGELEMLCDFALGRPVDHYILTEIVNQIRAELKAP